MLVGRSNLSIGETQELESILSRLSSWNEKANKGKYLSLAIVDGNISVNNEPYKDDYFSLSAYDFDDDEE